MRYYVYELVDPRDLTVFYVGKGSGDRILGHELEAKRGVVGPKCDLIRDIWNAGLKVERRYVRRFKAEAEALAFEQGRIAGYGLGSLTNRNHGFIPRSSGHPRPSQWTRGLLKETAPVMARALISISRGRLIAAGQDITSSIHVFVDGAIKSLGFDRVAAALMPFGVRIVNDGRPNS